MKKRIFAIFACFIFTAVMVTGCKKAPAPETPDTSTPAAEADALKPLTTEEVEQLYADATDVYADISMLTFPSGSPPVKRSILRKFRSSIAISKSNPA